MGGQHLRDKAVTALRWPHVWERELCVAKWCSTQWQERVGRWFWVMNCTEYRLLPIHIFPSVLSRPLLFFFTIYIRCPLILLLKLHCCAEKLSGLMMPSRVRPSSQLWNYDLCFLSMVFVVWHITTCLRNSGSKSLSRSLTDENVLEVWTTEIIHLMLLQQPEERHNLCGSWVCWVKELKA